MCRCSPPCDPFGVLIGCALAVFVGCGALSLLASLIQALGPFAIVAPLAAVFVIFLKSLKMFSA